MWAAYCVFLNHRLTIYLELVQIKDGPFSKQFLQIKNNWAMQMMNDLFKPPHISFSFSNLQEKKNSQI